MISITNFNAGRLVFREAGKRLGLILLLLTITGKDVLGKDTILQNRAGLVDVIKKIERETGYSIQVYGEVPENGVEATEINYSPQDILDGIRDILPKFGISGYAIEHNSTGKKMKIKIFRYNDEDELWTTDTLPIQEPVSVTMGDLKRIKEENTARLDNLTDDAVIFPATENGLGITLGEWKSVKADYYGKLENQGDTRDLMPASEHGSGITLGELRNLKNKYQDKQTLRGSSAEILPSSGSGRGLTLGELEQIKEVHKIKMDLQSGSKEVLPPSMSGPGITQADLRAIKEKYRSELNFQTDNMEIFPSEASLD